MVKVGDQVVVVGAPDDSDCNVGDVLNVFNIYNAYGFWARSINGIGYYVRMAEADGNAEVIVRPYTETEAEKRGAKFGVTGVVKATGNRVVFVKERNGFWRVFDENGMDYDFKPSEIRLDHEPEFVAWEDAPEELKYDASRVYYDGKPVKWVAKPEGANIRVVFVCSDGWVRNGGTTLTVKL